MGEGADFWASTYFERPNGGYPKIFKDFFHKIFLYIDRKSQVVSSTSEHGFSCDRCLNMCLVNEKLGFCEYLVSKTKKY